MTCDSYPGPAVRLYPLPASVLPCLHQTIVWRRQSRPWQVPLRRRHPPDRFLAPLRISFSPCTWVRLPVSHCEHLQKIPVLFLWTSHTPRWREGYEHRVDSDEPSRSLRQNIRERAPLLRARSRFLPDLTPERELALSNTPGA